MWSTVILARWCFQLLVVWVLRPIVDLEHSNNVIDVIDYKKIAIGKLRGIVEEKGIVADASKMKKVEILKALGHE